MEVFIHPGLHKTGSSSVQEALRLFSKRPQASNRKIEVVISDSELVAVLDLPIKDQPETLIISNESLFGEFYDFYSHADSKMVELKDALRDHVIIDVTFCFRSYPRWIESCFAQSIHEGRTQSPRDFVDIFFALSDPLYSRLIGQANYVFGQEVVNVKFVTSDTDIVEELSAAWSEKLGFELNLRSPARLNTSSSNLAALWILYQMNESPLGSQSNYRNFLQKVQAGSGQKFSVFPVETQKRLVDFQRLDCDAMRQLLTARDVLSRLEDWLGETTNSWQLPEWGWPSVSLPGFAQVFASTTQASRLKDDRLRVAKQLIVKVSGPWIVVVWRLLKQGFSRKVKD